MGTLLDFAAKMEARAANLAPAASALKINAAAQLIEALIIETPVDTSQAKSNWQIGINGPPTDFLPPYVPGKGGDTATESELAAYQAALDMLALAKPGDVIYVSNNAPYITNLNNGSSTQAPAGFVEVEIQKVRVWLQSSAAKVNLDGR